MSQPMLDSHPPAASSLPRCSSSNQPSSPQRSLQHHSHLRRDSPSSISVPANITSSKASPVSSSRSRPSSSTSLTTHRHQQRPGPTSLPGSCASSSTANISASSGHPVSLSPPTPTAQPPERPVASPADLIPIALPLLPTGPLTSQPPSAPLENLTQQAQLQRQHRDEAVREVLCAAQAFGRQDWVDLMLLSHLASQHHLSPYSLIKFGVHGSPFAYVPLSLQQPDLVEETWMKQRAHEAKAAAWLHLKRGGFGNPAGTIKTTDSIEQQSPHQTSLEDDECVTLCTPEVTALLGVKRPASAAAVTSRATSVARTQIDSHAGQILQDKRDAMDWRRSSPEPSALSLRPSSVVATLSSKTSGSSASTRQASSDALSPLQTVSRNRDNISEASLAAMSFLEVLQSKAKAQYEQEQLEKEATACMDRNARDDYQGATEGTLAGQNLGNSTAGANGELKLSVPQQSLAIKTSDTHPINISAIVPPEMLSYISREIWDKDTSIQPRALQANLRRSATAITAGVPLPSLRSTEEHAELQIRGEALIRVGPTLDLSSATPSMLPARAAADPEAAHPATSLVGNLFMSSCPGKKVRLSGPVRGRGAICRDLGLDLARIAALGVGAVICCLDDEELDFLGAPWPEYERQADALGMHVVRLPMAEGYAPTCVKTIDATVSALVTDYTLRGRHLLVHCRGGVGRAGLIACAWMLKLGLVQPSPESATCSASAADGSPATPRILDLVTRLVDTIRRRRSPKAIETAEQVRFIVEYAAYLDRQEALCAARCDRQ